MTVLQLAKAAGRDYVWSALINTQLLYVMSVLLRQPTIVSKAITRNVILTVVFALFGFSFGANNPHIPLVNQLIFAYIFAGIPWGWSALSRITPNIFLILPLIGWVVYFFIKLFLSMFVGLVALPLRVLLIIKEWQRAKSLKFTAALKQQQAPKSLLVSFQILLAQYSSCLQYQ